MRTRTNDEITLPNGTLLVADSVVTYRPKADYNGTDSFHYTIRDADGQVSTANVTLTINPVNDQPIQAGTLDYTIVQGNALDILASGGIVNRSLDADTDPITVVQQSVPASVGGGFTGTTLGLQPDGAFLYAPDPAFVGIDTFDIKLFDGSVLSDVYTVTISVTPAPPPPPPPPPGTVTTGLDLAQLPLEDAVSAEANVLVIMDDSGSMDWTLMTNEANGLFQLRNTGVKDAVTTNATNTFEYLIPLATNNSNSAILPTEAALNASAIFVGNHFGVWRGRNSQFNTVYYNPAILYRPWVGLNRSGVDFPNSPPTAAVLDPYESPARTINLTTPLTFTSNNVPRIHGAGSFANLTQHRGLSAAVLHDDGGRTPLVERSAYAGRNPQRRHAVSRRRAAARLRRRRCGSDDVHVCIRDPELRELVHVLPQPGIHGEGRAWTHRFGRHQRAPRLRGVERFQPAHADGVDERLVSGRRQEGDDESDLQGCVEQRHAAARRAR